MADKARGLQTKRKKPLGTTSQRLAAAKASARAIANFGHQEPSATELAKRFGISVGAAKMILQEIFGDVILERKPRGTRPVAPLPGRGLGLGNLVTMP